MAGGQWHFESRYPWQDFAHSFRERLSSWHPSGIYGILNWDISFEKANSGNGAFAQLDAQSGQVFDVLAVPQNGSGQKAVSYVRLTLHSNGTKTLGVIDFNQPAMSVGKELGDYAKKAMQQVDSSIQF